MSDLAAWGSVLPQAVVLLVLLLAPGALALRALGYRGLLLVAAAPPTSAAGIALLGLVYQGASIRFGLLSVTIGLAVLVALTWGAAALVRGRVPAAPPDTTGERVPGSDDATTGAGRWPRTHAPVALAVLVGWLVMAAPALTGWDPSLPAQQIDPVYHHNLAWTITQTGNASLLTGASWSASLLYATRAYYPLVWHAMVALASEGGAQVVGATNVLVVLVPLVWCLGVAACAAQVLPRVRLAPVVAVAAATMFPVFPAYMLYTRQLWPNAFGYAVFPAVLAMLVHAVRLLDRPERLGRRRALLALAAVTVAGAGAAATYPAAVFSILLTGTPLLVAVLARVCRFVWARRRHLLVQLLLVALAAGAALAAGTLLSSGGTAIIARLIRQTAVSSSTVPTRLLAMATLWPRGATSAWETLRLNLQVVLVAVSLVLAWRQRRTRWVVWAWVLPMVLLAAAYFPLGPLSALTGLWYNDAYRIMPLVALSSVLLLTVTGGRVLTWAAGAPRPRRRWALAGLAAAVLVPAVAAQGAVASVTRSAYDPKARVLVRILSVEEVRMIESLRGRLDPGLMVLGDPAAGAAYVQAIAGSLSVFPHLTFRAADTDARYLAEHFAELDEDPHVCELIHHYGIGYYYEDEAGHVAGVDVDERAPGLYGVDTSEGFEPVASGGGATVYRITACGTVTDPGRDPWVVNRPLEPLLDEEGRTRTYPDAQGASPQEG